jgi:hypothetical protein
MKSIVLIVLCLGFISASAPVLSKNWVLEKTSVYSPFTFALLSEYAKYPNATVSNGGTTISSSMKPFEFIDFTSEKTILESISTSVHETMHAYNGFIPVIKKTESSSHVFKQEGYMLDINRFKILTHVDAPLFPSRDLVPIIPESLKTFRFKTYVAGIPNLTSTQSSGVYGLLDEFLAYYSGSKVIFDLKPLFLEYYDSYYGFVRWSTEFSSNQGAFYEFDFFIKEYLLYAKKNRPQLYEQLKHDPDFCEVYQTIQLKFIELTKQYEKEYDQFMLDRKKAPSTGLTYHFSKFYDDIYKVLQPQLQNVRYDVIEKDFGVK